MKQQIGKNLQKIRKERHISATEMSKSIGISRTTLWRFENGGDLSVIALEKYAKELGMEVYFIVNPRC